jgi:hypothetical protein
MVIKWEIVGISISTSRGKGGWEKFKEEKLCS